MSYTEQKSGRTGRPRGFDGERAVAQARDLFWTQGLAATSYVDLTAATGLHRPSICAAFGGKEGFFRAALTRYLQDSAALLVAALSRPTLGEALEAFFATDIELFAPPEGGRGCFAFGVAAEAGRADPELARAVEAVWSNLSDAIDRRIRSAPASELPTGMDAALVVDLVLATHATLAARSRAGASIEELRGRETRFVRLFTERSTQASTRS